VVGKKRETWCLPRVRANKGNRALYRGGGGGGGGGVVLGGGGGVAQPQTSGTPRGKGVEICGNNPLFALSRDCPNQKKGKHPIHQKKSANQHSRN